MKRKHAVPIPEAARLLGVTERTIYRRVQSGKLQRADVSDTVSEDVAPSVYIEIEDEILCQSDVRHMSDMTLADQLRELREDLRRKDDLIERLLQNEQETARALHAMQEQLVELAKIVLAREARATSDNRPNLPNLEAGSEPEHWLARLWSRRSSPRNSPPQE